MVLVIVINVVFWSLGNVLVLVINVVFWSLGMVLVLVINAVCLESWNGADSCH